MVPKPGHLFPLLFLLVACIGAIPPFIIHLLLRPHVYLVSTASLRTRFSHAKTAFFYFAWRFVSPIMDRDDGPHKAALLAQAYGTVLEIGAGVGDNIKYLTRNRITRLVLVEPNIHMHAALRKKANAADFREDQGSLLLLGCGAAAPQEAELTEAGFRPESVDCVLTVHVLCSLPQPASTIELYRRLLRPGGLLIFYEHVKSEDESTAAWQDVYTRYIWREAMDGCELDRPTGAWIMNGAAAAETHEGGALPAAFDKKRWTKCDIGKPKGQNKYTCLPHVQGIAVKA